jgi:FkbM family methyltransferase
MNKVKRCRYGHMIYQPNDLYIGRSLELYGEFSEAEVELFRRLVRPGDSVLDVGANIGAHTVPLAQLTAPAGQVLAFEPQRLLYYCLCANVLLANCNHVGCYHAAVGEARRSLRVPELDYSAEKNFGGLDLSREYGSPATYEVPVLTIDDLHLKSCHFMKIDVEGMERQVLEGAVATIRAFQPLLYVEDDRQEKSADLRALLVSLGYEIYAHRPPYYNPANFAQNPRNVFPNIVSMNLYAYPRASASPVRPEEWGMMKVS